MNKWRLVKLDFGQNPVHFGEVGLGSEESSERVHSDTLFSSWINAYARLMGKQKVENLLARFLSSSEPPFKISSTFIYSQQNDIATYYLPCPFQSPPNYPQDNLNFFSLHQKLQYLPLTLWQRWYQGRGFTERDYEQLTNFSYSSQTDGELEQARQYHRNYLVYQVAKTAVDRVNKTVATYSVGFTKFLSVENHYSGLYFLLYLPEEDENLENYLQAALDFLGEEGLGGERSCGAGRFRVSWQPLPQSWWEVITFKAGTHYCLLSLFWQPSLTQKFLQNSRYQFKERGGWVFSPFSGQSIRRQKVHMLTEGSIFPSVPLGKLADVTPPEFRTPHSIFRSGISLTIPIYLN